MSLPTLNILISGISRSGDVETGASPTIIQLGNNDAVNYATFALQNAAGTYTSLLLSGPPTTEILINGMSIHKGNVERIDHVVSTDRGHVVVCHSYGVEQELLGFISADYM